MSSDWLSFVKAFCGWSTWRGSRRFWGLFVFRVPSSELQFVFRWRISCHMHFLSYASGHVHFLIHDCPLGNVHVTFCWCFAVISLGWLEVIDLGQQLTMFHCLGKGLTIKFYWLTQPVVAVAFIRLLDFSVELYLYTRINCSSKTCL